VGETRHTFAVLAVLALAAADGRLAVFTQCGISVWPHGWDARHLHTDTIADVKTAYSFSDLSDDARELVTQGDRRLQKRHDAETQLDNLYGRQRGDKHTFSFVIGWIL
jgi:cellobiose-specific phosphotransferase system component IIA